MAYDPSAADGLKQGDPAPYLYLANAFENISETTKRLEIARCSRMRSARSYTRARRGGTRTCWRRCTWRRTSIVATAASRGWTLGIGDATLIKALAEATGREESAVKVDYKNEGDLGIVAMMSRSTQKTMFAPPKLTIAGVLKEFRAIATTEGNKSVDARRGRSQLLVAARECEAGYIVRSLQGKLRIGLAQQTVTQALAHAVVLHSPRRRRRRRRAGTAPRTCLAGMSDIPSKSLSAPLSTRLCPRYSCRAGSMLPERCHFRPGVPVKPMLAKPTNGVREVLARFAEVEFTCEYKYDGERAQIHLLEDGSVKIFSRNQEGQHAQVPGRHRSSSQVPQARTKSVVIDAEAVAFDRETGRFCRFRF